MGAAARPCDVGVVQRLMTPAANIISTLRVCAVHTDCGLIEKCYGGKCISPIDSDGSWYGLGVGLSENADFEGFPNRLSHSGGQDNVATYFFISRAGRNGIVIMVNGESKWKKKGVEYGADFLQVDISEAFFRTYYP